MLKQVEKTMHEHGMLDMKSVLVGLSGGADSCALLYCMCALSKKYGFSVTACHVHHGLRGDTADRDAEFSREFAKRMQVPFLLEHTNVREYAQRTGQSEELAGREARYRLFVELMKANGIDYTATAHHKNDNAETIIMNFLRGSGIKGLCGIPYKRGRIIRPLLDVSRAEIEAFCREHDILYVTDETNLENKYTRNKIRNILIPELEKMFNPSVTDTLTKNAAVLRQDEDCLSELAVTQYKKYVKDNGIDIRELKQMHPAVAGRVIRQMVDRSCGTADISSQVFSQLYRLAQADKTGSKADINVEYYARIEYDRLIISKREQGGDDFEYHLHPGDFFIPEMNAAVHIEYADTIKKDGAEYFTLPREDSVITIRNRRAGDKFRPFGMKGTKKVKDYMVDEKIPQNERSKVGILTIDGEIAWIVGYRRADCCRFSKKGIKIQIMY